MYSAYVEKRKTRGVYTMERHCGAIKNDRRDKKTKTPLSIGHFNQK